MGLLKVLYFLCLKWGFVPPYPWDGPGPRQRRD